MQPVCPHEQSMSGIFSIASHWVLQYLPDVVTHEQTGCAHFSAFGLDIFSLLNSDQQQAIQEPHGKHLGKAILSTNGQIAFFVARRPRLGYPRMIEMEFSNRSNKFGMFLP